MKTFPFRNVGIRLGVSVRHSINASEVDRMKVNELTDENDKTTQHLISHSYNELIPMHSTLESNQPTRLITHQKFRD